MIIFVSALFNKLDNAAETYCSGIKKSLILIAKLYLHYITYALILHGLPLLNRLGSLEGYIKQSFMTTLTLKLIITLTE